MLDLPVHRTSLALAVLIGTGSLASAADSFQDVSAVALPGVVTTCGAPQKDWILEVNGGGLALADFDGDGALDLVVVDGSTLERVEGEKPSLPARLFLGDGKGAFRPAGESWDIESGRWGTGAATGDVNGDGWTDLLITHWGVDRLFLNDRGRGFVDATAGSGLGGERWGTSAAFLDYDRDGALDLVVVNYLAFRLGEVGARGSGGCAWKGHPVMCGPEGLVPVHDQLYRGRGDGTFEEVSLAAGFRPAAAGYGLGVMTLDYDQDGDTDLYITNDSTPNHLWDNQGDGTFREVGFRRGVGYDSNGREQAGMGVACGDVDGDGRADLFVTNFSGENNALYRSSRGVSFRERSTQARLAGPSLVYLGWGTGFSDFDLDGDLDLFVLNGHVYPEADRPGTDTRYAQPDQLYRNDGSGRFALEPLYDGPAVVSRAGVAGDLDGDGDEDLVALAVEGPVRVLRNEQKSGGHWLRVRLRSSDGNTHGLGARVVAEWEGGSARREVRTCGGYQAARPSEVHFGLGPVEALERLTVHWPSGEQSVLEDVAVDRVLTIEADE